MPIVRRSPRSRRLHYLSDDGQEFTVDVPTPTEQPTDPWASPYPAQMVQAEQAYAPENPLPVVQLTPDSGVEVVDVAPFPDPSPMGYLEGLIEYALPALALYVVMDDDAAFLMRAAAGYAAYRWAMTSPVSPLLSRGEGEVRVNAYRGYSPCGCGG